MKSFRLCRSALLVLLCVAVAWATRSSAKTDGNAASQGRLAPPESVKCPHNDLTVYEGRVIAYRRDVSRTFLRIRTDAETTESVTIRHGRARSPVKWFLLRAEPFQPSDWKLIEARRGRLRPRLRVHAWVCTDGSNPVVDWQPPVD